MAKKGRPKHIPLDLQPQDRPENFPTLIRYLEASGRVKHTSTLQMMRARHMYIRGVAPERIADDLNLEPNVIERWALCFSWEEERDRRLFESFRKFSGGASRYGQNLGERHDRIAGSIEQVAERLLHQHQNGKISLDAKALSTIASTIKTTQDIRRVARGESTVEKQEKNVSINVNMPQSLERIAAAMVDAYDKPKLIPITTKQIAVEIGEAVGTDAEYETIDRNSEEST